MAVRIIAAYYYIGRFGNNPPAPNFSAWTLETEGPRYFESGTGEQVINQHVSSKALFLKQTTARSDSSQVNVQGNHASQVRTQAARGTVLLKNTANALPLTGNEKFLAIIGNDAGTNSLGPNG